MINVMKRGKSLNMLSLPLILLLIAGCGSSQASSSLISIEVSGGIAGAHNKLVVYKDGKARCNKRAPKKLSKGSLRQARSITTDIAKYSGKDFSQGDTAIPDARQYSANTGAGEVEWSDGVEVAAALDRVVQFYDRTQAKLC